MSVKEFYRVYTLLLPYKRYKDQPQVVKDMVKVHGVNVKCC